MSRATKRKHVLKELFEDDYSLPKPNQQIVHVVSSRGNYLLEVETVEHSKFLISVPTKFRRCFWVKRGDYVLIEPIEEGDKVKGEIVRILTKQHIKYFKKDNVWPSEFDKSCENFDNVVSQDELPVNMNRVQLNCSSSSSEEGSDDEDACPTGKTSEESLGDEEESSCDEQED